jgi:hypothetical protein
MKKTILFVTSLFVSLGALAFNTPIIASQINNSKPLIIISIVTLILGMLASAQKYHH